jgi:TonB-linked SusC/RagA family outer membrane protein
MKKIYFLLTMALLMTAAAWSQNLTITGQVKNPTNEPVPFATVSVKGTSTSVSADQNGNFSISAPLNSTLVISGAGFEPYEVVVSSSAPIVAVLSSSNPLTEVVVTALGITREAKSLGYSTQKVTGAELTKARETNIVNSLAGKVAGVRVTSQSGTLGGSSKIIIRGVSSFSSSSQPIFVVDGLPIDNGTPTVSTQSGAAPTASASVDFGNRASDINPDDIEDIQTLKGAAATALYGARAKNGAIIITTKRGKRGATNVTVNSSTRFDKPLRLPDFQNEYAQGNYGVYNRNNLNGWGPKISDVQDRKFLNFLGDSVTLQAYPNNIKDFYETGNTYFNTVSVDGGGETGDFRLTYSNTIQDGIIPNQSLLKNSISLNAGRKVSSKFDVRANMNYTGTSAKGRPVQSSNDPNILGNVLYNIPRNLDINLIRDNYLDPATGQQIPVAPSRTGNNPYWIINNNGYSGNVDRVFGNLIANYKILDWLSLSNNLGLDFYNEFRRGVTRNGTIGALTGNFLEANIFNRVINNDLILTATKDLTPDLQLRVMGGGNVYETYYRRNQVYAQDLTIDKLYNFANAASTRPENVQNKKRIVGAYGEIALSYKEFLFLNATGRNDWSSTLPISNRSYFYPAVTASFVFSEFIDKSWLSFGKLRANWASVGSDDDPYLTSFTYNPVSASFAQYGYGVTFPFNGALAYSVPITKPAFDLKPQNQKGYEVGLELRFLKDRIKTDITYYSSKTYNQIVALTVPNSTGYRTLRTNAGTVSNAGIEVYLGVVPFKTKNFTWNTDFNFSANENKVSDIPSSLKTYSLASGWSSLQIRAENGKSIGMYGTGWVRDPQGNIVIDPSTGLRTFQNDVRLGNLYPDWMLGINNSFTFKNFNLSFLVDIRKGGSIYSSTASSVRTGGLAIETLANRDNIFIDKGVLDEGDGKYVPNNVPVQSMQDFWQSNFSTDKTEANVFDGSYAKLRELRISYTIPSGVVSRSKFIKSIELGLEGRNLWIIHSNVPHIDPEANFFTNAGNVVGEGVEFNSVPSTRSLGFNVRLKF